jgi:predicted MFS family arabinose efflux permease
MSSTPASVGATGWRTPAVIIVCGCLVAMLAFGPRSSMGLFIGPLSETRGWGRDVFALAMAIQNILWGLGGPFAGALADRYGPAPVLAGGGVLIGLGLAGASFGIVIAGFSRMVPAEKRSWSMGIATAAGSMGQFLFAPMGQAFIAGYGWQTALVLLGGSMLLVPVLASAFAGSGGMGNSKVAITGANVGFLEAVRQAFRHRSYVLLVSGFFVCGFQLAFITTHLPPYLTVAGISPGLAAWALALIGLFNVVGSYTSGVLGGKMSKRYLLVGNYFLRGVSTAVFILLPVTPASVVVYAAVMGLLWLSTVPPTSGLVALMFGTRYLGMLYGFAFFSHQVGAFIGVWLGGVLYERTGSYDVVWWMSVALAMLAGALPGKRRGGSLSYRHARCTVPWPRSRLRPCLWRRGAGGVAGAGDGVVAPSSAAGGHGRHGARRVSAGHAGRRGVRRHGPRRWRADPPDVAGLRLGGARPRGGVRRAAEGRGRGGGVRRIARRAGAGRLRRGVRRPRAGGDLQAAAVGSHKRKKAPPRMGKGPPSVVQAVAGPGDQYMCWPPLTDSVEPVMKPLSSSTRYSTALAISSAWPRRPTGILATIFSSTWAGTARTMSVSM